MLFRRGDMPEPAPEWARTLAPGFTVKRMASMDALDAYLRANHVDANDAYKRTRFQGGVIPSKREVVLPAEGLLRDPNLERAIAEHEYAHTHGLIHHEGKGWFEQQAQAAAPAGAFNWGNVFAHPPTETAATQNLFRGR